MRSLDRWQQCNSKCTRNCWVTRLWSCWIERPLPISQKLAKPELQSKRCSSDSWTRLLRHSSPFWSIQNCTIGSEVKDWLGLRWSATSEAGSNSCHNSNINCRWHASNREVTGHSKEEHRAIKILEQTTRFTGERCEVGLLWREDEVKLPNNFYSAMGN